MGLDYALVHLKYTIPPAIILTLIHCPFCTRLDLYKILFLISVAVTATVPWDSYLIRRQIWTYPANAIVGPVLFSIPAEELFFFIIQTYNTSLLYLLTAKPVLHSAYLWRNDAPKLHGDGHRRPQRSVGFRVRVAGQVLIGLLVAAGTMMILDGRRATYMGLILAWASPFALILWSIGYPLIVRLPLLNTLAPIALPTLYLWCVDTLALKRGTWSIQTATKLGLHLWPGLEVEEALFFLATNTIIVLGLVAFDYALAVLYAVPEVFPSASGLPSPATLLKAIWLDRSRFNERRLAGIAKAVDRLERKSRSFSVASAIFEGRLRIDLILLYSYCRVADDLVDNASSMKEASSSIRNLRDFLDVAYSTDDAVEKSTRLEELVKSTFSGDTQDALLLLPTAYLSAQPLYDLLLGFKTDLRFQFFESKMSRVWPIGTEDDLELYALQVAGTVAELCLELVFHHAHAAYSPSQQSRLVEAGRRMGIALQLVNIARDVVVDAQMGRVYLPQTWLQAVKLAPEDVLKQPDGPKIELLQDRLLEKAQGIYGDVRCAIEELPASGRSGMRVAVESYMEIGRVLKEKKYQVKAGRATVPPLRRLRVAWQALTQM